MDDPSVLLFDDTSRHDATKRDASRHTLTIKQSAQLFASLGVPRSPRSVQRFCEPGNLDAIRVKGEKTERYFIDPVSVERYAKELRQLENISQIGSDVSRHDVTQHDMSRSDATDSNPSVVPAAAFKSDHQSEGLLTRVDTLEKEKLQLQIDRAAKEQVIGHMIDERRQLVDQLTALSRENGRLEMHVQQLAAPATNMSRHDATEVSESIKGVVPELEPAPAIVEPSAQTSVSLTAETPSRSAWKNFFG
jgi:hypothetical protein